MYCKILHKMYQAIKTSVFGKYIWRKGAKEPCTSQMQKEFWILIIITKIHFMIFFNFVFNTYLRTQYLSINCCNDIDKQIKFNLFTRVNESEILCQLCHLKCLNAYMRWNMRAYNFTQTYGTCFSEKYDLMTLLC